MEKQIKNDDIFQTAPSQTLSNYQNYLKDVKQYTKNLNNHLNKTFDEQDKSIKRKRAELQKQLNYLRQKYYHQRQKIREMEEYFVQRCQKVLKSDIAKWSQYQNYFNKLFQHYQYEIEIQTLINQRNTQKLHLLKAQIKQDLRQDIKHIVEKRLFSSNKKSECTLSKSKLQNIRLKRSTSLMPPQMKMKTEISQTTLPTEKNQDKIETDRFSNVKIKKRTQLDESLMRDIPQDPRQRIKTQMSLPSLKKSNIYSPQKFLNNDYNFMKPIRTLKKSQHQQSILPEIIKMLQQSKLQFMSKSKTSNSQINWFEKIVFNNRNFEKIIEHLQQELDLHETLIKKKYSQSGNKVKDLVAKNLFRLKTQSSSSIKLKKSILMKQKLPNRHQKSKKYLQSSQTNIKI